MNNRFVTVKTILMVLVALSIGLLSACSSWRYKPVTPVVNSVNLIGVVDGQTELGKMVSTYHYGDMVYAYVTLPADKTVVRPENIAVKWYNAAGGVVAERSRTPDYAKNPHHVWFWINSAQLGQGAVKMDVLMNGQFMKSFAFNVVEPRKLAQQESWYKRLFNRYILRKTSKTTAATPAAANLPNPSSVGAADEYMETPANKPDARLDPKPQMLMTPNNKAVRTPRTNESQAHQ